MTATDTARAVNALVQAALDYEESLRVFRATPNSYIVGPSTDAIEAAVLAFKDAAAEAAMEHWWDYNEARRVKLDEMVTKKDQP